MKIFYFYLLFILYSSFHSQTLQVTVHRPSVGDTSKMFVVDTTGFIAPMPNSVSGNAAYCDFSPIVNTGSLQIQTYVSATAVASASAYAGCNLVLSSGSGGYNYLKTSDTPSPQLELLGLNFGSFAQVTFTNTAQVMKFPFTYGQNFSDPASGTFSANTGTTTLNGTAVGNFTTSADGQGTLILGQQTLSNILRIKSTQQFTLFQGFLPLGTIRSVIYSYYRDDHKFPLLQIQYQTLSLIAQTPSSTASVRMDGSIPFLGISENSYQWEPPVYVYPIPSHDYIHVHHYSSGVHAYKILSSEGKEIQRGSISGNQEKNKIHIENLPQGIYILQIFSDESEGSPATYLRFIKMPY